MAKVKKQWYYVYMTTCGPCAKITPIIDSLIACGTNISKITFQEFQKSYPKVGVRGTPSIIQVQEENGVATTINNIPSNTLIPLVDLSSSAPDLVTLNGAEYILSKVNES